jgi:uncharacterized membrane protein YgcG
MSTSLRSSVKVEFGWTWRDLYGLIAVVDSNRLAASCELADGAGANQADVAWHATGQSLAAGNSVVYDLGALGRPLFGDVITVHLGTVRALLIVNKNTAADGYLLVGGAGSGEWAAPFGMVGDTLKVMPGSPLVLANLLNGWAVDWGSDQLKLAAIGDAVAYDIAILGNAAGASSGSGSSGSGSSGSGSSSSGSSGSSSA